MADNLDFQDPQAPPEFIAATDEIANVHYQKVKLAIGASDSATLLTGGIGAADAGTPRVATANDSPEMAKLDTIATNVAAVTAKLIAAPSTAANQAAIIGYVDGIEAALTTLAGHVDGLETLIASTNTKLDAANTSLDNIETSSGSAAPVNVYSPVQLVDVTLTIDTAAYASGDLIADTQVVAAATRADDALGVLHSLVLVDEADLKMALTIHFFSANVSCGTENAAPSLSDANAANWLGKIDIAVSDYFDFGGVSMVEKTGLNKIIKPAAGTDDIFVAVVNGTGAPTYGSASALKLRIGVLS